MTVGASIDFFESALRQCPATVGAFKVLRMVFLPHCRDTTAADRGPADVADTAALLVIVLLAEGHPVVVEEAAAVEMHSTHLNRHGNQHRELGKLKKYSILRLSIHFC